MIRPYDVVRFPRYNWYNEAAGAPTLRNRHMVKCIALPVTKREMRHGHAMQARTEGIYLYRGQWYGRDCRKHSSHGKMYQMRRGRVVGRVGTLTQARRQKFY